MSLQLRVLFLINEFTCDPAEISGVLGIQASRTWKMGEMKQTGGSTYRSSGWMLESPLADHDSLEIHASSLLGMLPPDLHALAQVSPSWSAKLFCSLYTSGDRPALCLAPAAIARLAALGAGFDLDLYVVPDAS